MTELLTAAQMRAIESAVIESGAVTGLELMERAGRGVVEAVFEEWPELAAGSYRAVVLCGPGNNGGDGFVVARLLKEWGWAVEVFLYGDPGKLPPDARVNYERWRALGEVKPLSERTWEETAFPGVCQLLVDALFGTGLGRPVELPLGALPAMGELGQKHKVVSVDMPSGLCSDSGKVIGDVNGTIDADLTVSFHSKKPGHLLAEGPNGCGNVVVVDIGLSPVDQIDTLSRATLICNFGERRLGRVVVSEVLRSNLSRYLSKEADEHKYAHGHALILSGGPGKTGAARLAARASLRIGAGLVTLGVPGAAQLEVAGAVTAVMLRRAGTPEELTAVLEDGRINALCLGPGLGVSRARGLVEAALAEGPGRGVVLDADALTAFEAAPEALFGLLGETCVLTPHGGEFARLFPDIAEKLAAPATRGPAYSKVDATREAAARAGCVVLFKGADTVIADAQGRCSIHSAQYERVAPWLATAGSGDVLAGFITGLLARGFGPMQAAETAAWLHVECALSFGPGLIAEDLAEELPKVFRKLGL